jgi:hypothetical protein
MLIKVGEDIRLVVLGAESSKVTMIGNCSVPVAKLVGSTFIVGKCALTS